MRMELNQIRIANYKKFTSTSWLTDEPFKNALQFDLDKSLTTLVGPNSAGKTTLLEAIQLFCTAVKHGSMDYSLTEGKELFGFEHDVLDTMLQGLFTVHYHATAEIETLILNVILGQVQLKKKNHLRVVVTVPCANMGYSQLLNISPSSSGGNGHVFLYSADNIWLRDLLPDTAWLDCESVLNSRLTDLFQRLESQRFKKEINEEIRCIFPCTKVDARGNAIYEIISSDVSNVDKFADVSSDDQREPTTRTSKSRTQTPVKFDNSSQNNTSCGNGLFQCIMLIATVCCAKPNSIILIDEPDTHMFSNAQRLLIDFFYRKLKQFQESNHFCQMVITSHSPDIMQAVKLEDIRQIFLNSTNRPIAIKSLAGTKQLFDAMSNFGASIFTHGELVRLGVHRKILYLENHDDYNFLHGLIHRAKPELLNFSFTRMAKGGRTEPSQIKTLILQFRQILPKEATLHIFILLDADLRSNINLDKEKKEYDQINDDSTLNVRLYYHCWAAREWENWLLYNEDLLYEMLCGDDIDYIDLAIKQLRDKIQEHLPTQSILRTSQAFHQRQSVTAIEIIESNSSEYSNHKRLFEDWFKKELKRHFQILLTKLTLSNMEGTENISGEEEKALQHEACAAFLRDADIGDDIMSKFGNLRERIEGYIGYQLRQGGEKTKRRQQKSSTTERDEKEQHCRMTWLSDRTLPETIDTLEDLSEPVRKKITKWIDAKLFFHQLTHDEDSKTRSSPLDNYWKQAFAVTNSEDNLYERYFKSLDPQNPKKWAEDFEKLVEKFEKFVELPSSSITRS